MVANLDATTVEGSLGSPVLVISLPFSTQRRDAISRQLRDRKIDFEFVDGILIDSEQARLRTGYRPWRSLIVNGRELSRGEIGCYMAHLKALQRIYEAGWPYAIVLEDDTIIQSGFSSVIRTSIAQLSRFDVVKFASNLASKGFHAIGVVSPPYTLGVYLDGSYSAGGYILSRRAARIILQQLSTPVMPFDDALDGKLQSSLRVACWMPSPVPQPSGQSDIGDQAKGGPASLPRSRGLMRLLYKLYGAYARRRRRRAYKRILRSLSPEYPAPLNDTSG